jgi:hypothetical protein
MKDGGAEAEAVAGAAWGLFHLAIRDRWAVNSEWRSVMSAIICSGECGLIGPSKVGGGASDILNFWVYFVCYCYSALAMRMIGCAGPPMPSKIRMYHTLVVAPAFLAIFTIGPSATISR